MRAILVGAAILVLSLSDLARAANDAPLPQPIPFSFVYDGKPSSAFLNQWPSTGTAADGKRVFIDPATKLEVTWELRTFPQSSADEWVLWFKNTGSTDTQCIFVELKEPPRQSRSEQSGLGPTAS